MPMPVDWTIRRRAAASAAYRCLLSARCLEGRAYVAPARPGNYTLANRV